MRKAPAAGSTAILLLQKALQVEPFGEAVDPMIRGEVLLAHAEAVAAFGVHVQLGGLVRRGPLCVELGAIGSKVELVVRRGGNRRSARPRTG